MDTIKKMQEFMKVASDATRLNILFSLINEKECFCNCNEHKCCSHCKNLSCMIEKSVSEITHITKCSQSLISHQLQVLREADFVKTRKDGLRVYYSLKDGHIKELINIVKEHVEEK